MPLALSLCVIEFSESKQRLIDSLHLIWIIRLCTKSSNEGIFEMCFRNLFIYLFSRALVDSRIICYDH